MILNYFFFPFLSHSKSNQIRNYATLKDSELDFFFFDGIPFIVELKKNFFYFTVSRRLKSVKNIQKITKSMKMVSAAKYAKAEKDLKLARPYGLATTCKLLKSLLYKY